MKVRITIEADLRGAQGAIDIVRETNTVTLEGTSGSLWLRQDAMPQNAHASGTFRPIKVTRMRGPRQKTGGKGK